MADIADSANASVVSRFLPKQKSSDVQWGFYYYEI